jgi:hypothetical protein
MNEKKYVRRVDKVQTPLSRVDPLQEILLTRKKQCSAMSKRTGERCKNLAMTAQGVCRMHGGATRKSRVAAAKRIADASGYAADMLVEFMADPKVDMKSRTQIAQDLLTRAGVNGKQELDVMVGMMPKWEADLQELFVVYPDAPDSGRREVVEDAVIVPDDQGAIEAAHDAKSAELEQKRIRRKRQGYSGAPIAPPTARAKATKAVVRTQPPRQSRDVFGPDIPGPDSSP